MICSRSPFIGRPCRVRAWSSSASLRRSRSCIGMGAPCRGRRRRSTRSWRAWTTSPRSCREFGRGFIGGLPRRRRARRSIMRGGRRWRRPLGRSSRRRSDDWTSLCTSFSIPLQACRSRRSPTAPGNDNAMPTRLPCWNVLVGNGQDTLPHQSTSMTSGTVFVAKRCRRRHRGPLLGWVGRTSILELPGANHTGLVQAGNGGLLLRLNVPHSSEPKARRLSLPIGDAPS